MLARQGEFTVAAAAKEIGRSPDTIRRWIRQGKVKARQVQCGEQSVSVFTFKEITEMKAFAKTVKLGRPPVGAKPMARPAKKAPVAKGKTTKKVTPIPKATKKAPAKRKAS
jgi:transposase-like protein